MKSVVALQRSVFAFSTIQENSGRPKTVCFRSCIPDRYDAKETPASGSDEQALIVLHMAQYLALQNPQALNSVVVQCRVIGIKAQSVIDNVMWWYHMVVLGLPNIC